MHEFATVSFKCHVSNSAVNIQVIDVLGRNMGTFFNATMEMDDTQYFQLKAGQLTSGIYYVTFEVNGRQVLVKPIVVAE